MNKDKSMYFVDLKLFTNTIFPHYKLYDYFLHNNNYPLLVCVDNVIIKKKMFNYYNSINEKNFNSIAK